MLRRNLALWLVVASCAVPIIAAYAFYFWIVPTHRINYGELLSPFPAPDVKGTNLNGTPFELARLKGKWVLLMIDSGRCEKRCQSKLYATRQARTMQNRERDRIERLWLIVDDAVPAETVMAEHPDLRAARASKSDMVWLPAGADHESYVYLLDPLGNLMMRYALPIDIKRFNNDLSRLLKASRIG